VKFPKPTRVAKARKPLARYTRLKAKGKTSHASRPRDTEYMGKVAKLPCVVRDLLGTLMNDRACEGRITVDHAFGRYLKDADRMTIPLCEKHHREKTGQVGGGGFMAGWSVARRRGWLSIAIAVTREAILGTPSTVEAATKLGTNSGTPGKLEEETGR